MSLEKLKKEDKLIEFIFQRGIIQSAEELRATIKNQHQGANLSEKQKYFIGKLEAGLQYAYYFSKDIESENITWEVVKGILGAVAAGSAAKVITSFLGKQEIGDVIAITGGVLATIYCASEIADKLQAKKQAEKIINFLDTNLSEAPARFSTLLAVELCLQYRLAIDMLEKSNSGIDILVNFFIKRLLKIIVQTHSSQLAQNKDKNDDWKLDYLTRELTQNQAEIPETLLVVEKKLDLKWNLFELLRHAPLLVWTSWNDKNVYEFTTYINTADQKKRSMKTVSAEAS